MRVEVGPRSAFSLWPRDRKPWAREVLVGEEKHEHLGGGETLVKEAAEVDQVRRVEEDIGPKHGLELHMEDAGGGRTLGL